MNPMKSLLGIGVDRDDFKILSAPNIKGVAEYMNSKDCRKVVLMVCGARRKHAAGIPDFRSPRLASLYHNLARLNLPYPEAVFDMSFFRKNPEPFYSLAQELYPGKYKPTLTHAFITLLHKKNKLQMCFTQNIDTLERLAGVPDYKIIEAHGSFASQKCIKCQKPFDSELMKEHVHAGRVPRCQQCRGLVKPDIVFFGESSVPMIPQADLLIILGTSLTLCPRVLINMEKVGDIGRRKDDVVLLGECDKVVRDLCRELGWEDELVELWKAVQGEEEPADDKEAEKIALKEAEEGRKRAEEEASLVAQKAQTAVEQQGHPRMEDHDVNDLVEAINKELHLGRLPEPAPDSADGITSPPVSDAVQIPTILNDDEDKAEGKSVDADDDRRHEEDGEKPFDPKL
ncbi:DHS-like NAD/FAD-binding domain-containing protein [Schizophyllum amplum]|uniref:DHS-like NAD/FAD-binding domain-containing protein n=1 Tax=Schizophyllum amplum TaxID=97359 RepID=A0A550C8B3_9AGAR|nr:DHS-like NAD/FAD-binding domain-containing protein [Auriculariopsis ampla]